jgi:radical SAM protein with 4Fe4S-binding SPASM domain
MNAAPSDTFCILPWIHIYANPDGDVLPCCVADHRKPMGNLREQTIEEIWNDEEYKSMRQKMLKGEECSNCLGCYQQEEKGIESVRQSKNKKYEKFFSLIDNTNEDGSLIELSLKHFDIRWSNICNFKCRSCSSTYSSSWAKEDNDNGASKSIYIIAGGTNNDKLYSQFKPHFKSIETFYFAGGEPLLTDKHYDILEHLISIGNTHVEIEYNTNLSSLRYKDKSIIDLWKHFSNVNINASIDSWGDRAEYIREGTNWNEIEKNIRTIQSEAPHVKLNTGSVISIFNIYTIPEFLDSMCTLFNKTTYSPFFYNIINPHFFSADVIDDQFKEEILYKLSSVSYNRHIMNQIEKVKTYVKNSNYNKNLRDELLKQNNYYDKIRNRNFIETFPELFRLYQ